MSLDLPTLDRQLQLLTSLFPVTVTWNGTTYTGTKETPTFSETLMIGGFDYHVDLNFYIRGLLMPSPPDIGQVFYINGEGYKVLRVRPSIDSNQLLCISLGWARLGSAPANP